ncbi:MAG TPA: hypothetical protein VJC04_04080 [Candidatus Paceibacterota bacterium]
MLISQLKGVTRHGTEICISCHKDTGVLASLDVRLRRHYLLGQGQLCETCAEMFH